MSHKYEPTDWIQKNLADVKAKNVNDSTFTLFGRDKYAATLVHLWAMLHAMDGGDINEINEAKDCAALMESWLAADKGVCRLIPKKIMTALSTIIHEHLVD